MLESLHLPRGHSLLGISRGLLFGAQPREQAPTYKLLSPDILYSLECNKGNLGKSELSRLVEQGFTDEATYLVTKSLSKDKPAQQAFLEQWIDRTMQHPSNPLAVAPLLKETVQRLPTNTSVNAKKLFQLNRQGFELYQDRFAEISRQSRQNHETPACIAYAGVLGLRKTVEQYKETDTPVDILIPDWIEDPTDKVCGYQISLQQDAGKRVQLLPKDFPRPARFSLIDDTINTGNHMQRIWDFWTQRSGEAYNANHIRVVAKVPIATMV